jgi:exodeoxyribonuclease-3
MLTLTSWNVNGIRAAARKGFLDWLEQAQPDMLGLQETKAHPDQLTKALRQPPGYTTIWASAEKKGYSGVALYTKTEPLDVTVGLGVEEYDREGRTIVATYPQFVLIVAYFPNGGRDLSRVPFKMAYKRDLLAYCNQLVASGRHVVFCGDVNTAHQEIDLARPKSNQQNTGFLPHERAWIDQAIEAGYVDTFRSLYPEKTDAYTWWHMISRARERNVGWRLDYFFVNQGLAAAVVDATIHHEVYGSDHCPVSLTLDLSRL